MVKGKNYFVCCDCGFKSPRWLGSCPDCEAWNSFNETTTVATNHSRQNTDLAVVAINAIARGNDHRLPTAMGELDRVLGGGIVSGSLILIGGDPGIGKSTLMMQLAGKIAGQGSAKVLYVSGEESKEQLYLRGQRLGVLSANLLLLIAGDIFTIEEAVKKVKPQLIIIDSIQTLYNSQLENIAGSVTQIKEAGAFFLKLAKTTNIPVFLVGHVNKEGQLAGPKILEHTVDCVLYFEGDNHYSYRILRGIKNRFGSVNEVGVFQMESAGLIEVKDPSRLFLAERPKQASGSAVFVSMEGSRPILMEIQALVAPTNFGNPQRIAQGIDQRRLSMLLAVLEKKAGLEMSKNDVYVNVAGGMRLTETALDLALCAAIYSSLLEKPLSEEAVFCGEIGLTGEIRGMQHQNLRLAEAQKLGFKKAFFPRVNDLNIQAKDLEVKLCCDLNSFLKDIL